MDEKRKIVTLTITERCNLNCIYCYENNKSNRVIDIGLAKAIVEREIEDRGDFEGIEFDLFGGEPFIAFDVIKEISEYIKKCCQETQFPFVIFLTTNGTLVHGEIQRWLLENIEYVKCGLSLDGTKEMHDTNRSGSFSAIDIDFFRNNYPEQDVKMTISRESLNTLADGIIFLHHLGFEISCNLAYQIDWSDERNKSTLYRELMKLIDFYIANPDIVPCSMLGMGIENVGSYNSEKCVRFCGAGKETKAYDVEGNVYPCQFFMPLSIGIEKAMKARDIVFPDKEIPDNVLDKKCRDCVIKSSCPNCYGANYAASGSIYLRDMNMCILNKIIMKARSYLYGLKWQKGLMDENSEFYSTTLRAIIKIQNELDIDDVL